MIRRLLTGLNGSMLGSLPQRRSSNPLDVARFALAVGWQTRGRRRGPDPAQAVARRRSGIGGREQS